MSLDPWIDIDLFKAAENEIWEALDEAPLENGYYLPSFCREESDRPQYKTLRVRNPQKWENKHEKDLCEWLPVAERLPRLRGFLETLPLKELGRVKIFLNEAGQPVEAHRDHNECYRSEPGKVHHHHEFIWINTHPDRRLFICDGAGDKKIYTEGRAIFFNEVDLHGADPFPFKNFTLRIDGKFSEKFKSALDILDISTY